MAKPSFIHPEMLDHLGIYNTTCTIEEKVDGEDEYGEPLDSWQEVTGLINIPASIGPTDGEEIKDEAKDYAVSEFEIELKGVYEEITEKMRAVVDGKPYDILLPETDSRKNRTRLQVEIRR